MNIDIREYLRINPISVHELTLSDRDLDCFLTFPPAIYDFQACTQRDLVWDIASRIFPQILEGDEGGFLFNIDETTPLPKNMLVSYARSADVKEFISEFSRLFAEMRGEVDAKMKELSVDVALDYIGAVELQSARVGGRGRELYQNFSYARDFMWCCSQFDDGSVSGSDEVEIENAPRHEHPSTRAECFGSSIATNRGGGDLIGGRIGLGDRYRIALSNALGRDNESIFRPNSEDWSRHQGGLTYPLWGQNMMDFRWAHREHNNIPPAWNIFIRTLDELPPSSTTGRFLSRAYYALGDDWIDWDNDGKREHESGGIAVPKHGSESVLRLEDYTHTSLTDQDCLLRILTSDVEGGEPELRRQTIKGLLEIVAQKINQQVTKDGRGSMADQLKPLLDRSLYNKEDWGTWITDAEKMLRDLAKDVDGIRDSLRSQQPSAYVGRIIVSTKDDTERKVIEHYGGRKWKRHMNFLRGVSDADPSLDERIGEAYVELRPSNVPVHTHNVMLKNNAPSREKSWIAKDTGGEDALMVARAPEEVEKNDAVGLGNGLLEYHISPIEYDRDHIAIPHDNIPPYREVYIWECLETDQDEEQWRIKYDLGEAKKDSTARLAEGTLRTYDRSLRGYAPGRASADGWTFVKWRPERIPEDAEGDFTFAAEWEKIPDTYDILYKSIQSVPLVLGSGYKHTYTPLDPDYTPPIPGRVNGWMFLRWDPPMIPHGSTGEKTFKASWIQVEEEELTRPGVIWRTVLFLDADGSALTAVQKRNGAKMGSDFPSFAEKEGWTFNGWVDDTTGTKMEHSDIQKMKVWRNYTFRPDMRLDRYKITWDMAGHGVLPSSALKEYTIDDLPYTLPRPRNDGNWVFVNWFKNTESGSTACTRIEQGTTGNLYFQASWQEVHLYTATFKVGYGEDGGEVFDVTESPAGGHLVLPDFKPERGGYQFMGWWTEMWDGGERVDLNTKVNENATYYAHWSIARYSIAYSANGHGVLPSGLKEFYTINDGDYIPPSLANDGGYKFTGWSPERIFAGQHGDVKFVAQWEAQTYTITYRQHNARDDIHVMQEYGAVVQPPPAPSKFQHIFDGWWTEEKEGRRMAYDELVDGDQIWHAHWIQDAIQNINYIECVYGQDFTAKNDGWEETHHANHHRICTLKWVGSTYTRDWIAYQPGPSLAMICSRLAESTNKSNRYLYRPGDLENAYQTSTNFTKLTPLKSTTYVGVGGTAITSITPKNKNGILIDKIAFSPHASCRCQYSPYSTSNGVTRQDKDKNGKYGSFKAELSGTSPSQCLLSVGNVFKATMLLSDGSKIVKTVEGSSIGKSASWHSVDNNLEKEVLVFDFGENLKGKPKGVRTTEVTFETSGAGKDVFKLLLVNGLVVYKNTLEV